MPSGHTQYKSFIPMDKYPGTQIMCFGWVDYPEPLTWKQVWDYELGILGKVENIAYQLWNCNNKDIYSAMADLADYLGEKEANLKVLAQESFSDTPGYALYLREQYGDSRAVIVVKDIMEKRTK